MRDKLSALGLNSSNSVVIASGILEALGIRKSKDIDLVVSNEDFNRLKQSGKFVSNLTQPEKEILSDKLFEIGTSWDVLGKKYVFDDFKNTSVVIDEVRYITLDFLYKVKDGRLKSGTARPKDIEDLRLIEEYKRNQKRE